MVMLTTVEAVPMTPTFICRRSVLFSTTDELFAEPVILHNTDQLTDAWCTFLSKLYKQGWIKFKSLFSRMTAASCRVATYVARRPTLLCGLRFCPFCYARDISSLFHRVVASAAPRFIARTKTLAVPLSEIRCAVSALKKDCRDIVHELDLLGAHFIIRPIPRFTDVELQLSYILIPRIGVHKLPQWVVTTCTSHEINQLFQTARTFGRIFAYDHGLLSAPATDFVMAYTALHRCELSTAFGVLRSGHRKRARNDGHVRPSGHTRHDRIKSKRDGVKYKHSAICD